MDMLNAIKLDAVEILTPHALHFQQAIRCLDKGLHLLIEKPMTCTVRQAKNILARIKETEVVLISYQRHYQPEFSYIKKLIESGEIGDIQFISAMQGQNWMKGTKGTWRQDPKISCGGQLIDSASHLLDIILWTTGLYPNEALAFSENLDTLVDINSSISIRFNNNALASISIIGNSPCWGEYITIWGSKGVIFHRSETYGYGRIEYLLFNGEAKIEPVNMPKESNPDKNFINAILGKEKNESPPIGGLKVIELTEAIWKSAKTGKKIKIT
jgi:predicted dehydrogenase